MDGRDFSLRLKKIKAEVLALKQSHDFGLNRTNFDRRYIEESVSSAGVNFKLVILFDTRDTSQPYIQMNVYDYDYADIYTHSWNWDTTNKQLTVTGYYRNFHYGSFPYTEVAIVSAKPIISIDWSEV